MRKNTAKGLKVRLRGLGLGSETVEGTVVRLRVSEVTVSIRLSYSATANYERRYSLETGAAVVKEKGVHYQILPEDLVKLRAWQTGNSYELRLPHRM